MRRLLTLLAALTLAAPAQAQSASTLKDELVQQLEDAEKKLVALAETMPQDKYGWRPAPGVRSVSEVFMHMVGANLTIPRFAGITTPAPVQLARDAEQTINDKPTVVSLLRQSFAYAKQAVRDVPDAKLGEPVELFGRQSSRLGVLVLMAVHAHEHLGQGIAYARTNGVVPPWSVSGGN